jgi:hypothetical protein
MVGRPGTGEWQGEPQKLNGWRKNSDGTLILPDKSGVVDMSLVTDIGKSGRGTALDPSAMPVYSRWRTKPEKEFKLLGI